MKAIFDDLSLKCSKATTQAYSTSFSLGIRFLAERLRAPIHSIYGYVRLADEIVDSFHGYDKEKLLKRFRIETFEAIDAGISLNPILNSFQKVVREYSIPHELINTFLDSMEMDLKPVEYNREKFETYILGSAEVVGLMCLRVFVEGKDELYESLKWNAMKLGSAFQKINFLRDLKQDFEELGRMYFPGVDLKNMDKSTRQKLEADIEQDFRDGLTGIKKLPRDARFGVYVAYVYYQRLFRKICSLPFDKILETRIRIPNQRKYALFLGSYFRNQLNLL